MRYKIADIVVEFEPKYEMLKSRSEKYIENCNSEAGIHISLNRNDIDDYLKKYIADTEKEAEYVLTGIQFYKELLNYNGCMLHASCVVVDNEAYLFSADSGVGKSTHTGLWLKFLSDKKPYILNDDKPALRIVDNVVYAYGTPFSGKYDINENKKVKVKGICFLERAKENKIEKIDSLETIKRFWRQTITFLDKTDMNKFLDILECVLNNIPVYKLSCNMSEEAVKLAYKTMKGETNEG